MELDLARVKAIPAEPEKLDPLGSAAQAAKASVLTHPFPLGDDRDDALGLLWRFGYIAGCEAMRTAILGLKETTWPPNKSN